MSRELTDSEEETLVRKAKQKDRGAYRSIYDLHAGTLYAVCSRYIPNDEDAKDVLQDCFLKIYATIGTFQFRGAGSLKGWMTKIVINESLKFLKQSCHFEFSEVDSIPDIEDNDTDAELDSDLIFRMIRELPDGYRTIFNLYVIEEKTHKEIANMLGIKENTSASQLHRAKAMLAHNIKKYQLSAVNEL